MAGEAYRAVFLRIHPTGKMVLSLTTDTDGREHEYQELVARELGVPPLDVKVVPADTDRFGEGHGYNTTPSDGTSSAIVGVTDKILEKARLLAGASLQSPVDSLRWADGRFIAESGDATTIADVAMYSYGSGELPPGIEGGLDAQTVYRN